MRWYEFMDLMGDLFILFAGTGMLLAIGVCLYGLFKIVRLG